MFGKKIIDSSLVEYLYITADILGEAEKRVVTKFELRSIDERLQAWIEKRTVLARRPQKKGFISLGKVCIRIQTRLVF
jgi:hypothetical protein